MLKKQRSKSIFTIIFLLISSIIVLTMHWFKNSFSDVTLEQLIFHLKVPLEGSNNGFIIEYLKYNRNNFIFLVFFIICLIVYIKFFNHSYVLKFNFSIRNMKKNITIRIKNDLQNLFVISILFFFGSLVYVLMLLDVPTFIKNELHHSTIFEDYYVDPEKVEMKFPEKKQNLIYIFLESMESTYHDIKIPTLNRNNLIPGLERIANENIHFSNTEDLGGAYTPTGTTWTVAGMVSQTAGVPLTIPIDGNALNGDSSFLPGVYSLGQVLEKEGYNQLLMMGSESPFGGRSNYFNQHGHYEIFDYYRAVETHKIPQGYFVWWGYEDQKLFEYAKEKLTDLAKKDQPFNFTMLTADTHFTAGFMDDSCETITGNSFADSVICSDQKVSNFISWIQAQDFYEDTTIIISGDHLLMGNYLFDKDYSNTRTVYNTIINSRVNTEHTKNRVFTTLDMFPTTLAAMGVDIDGDRLGLGTNLFSTKKTLAEELGYKKFNAELQMKSTFYNKELLYKKKK